MTRTWVAVAGALSLVVSLIAGSAYAQSVEIFVSPATQNVAPNGNANVEVKINANGLDVGNLGLFLKYDTNKLTFQSATNNTTTWNNALATGLPTENSPGVLSWSAGANAAVNGQGVLVSTITFQAKDVLGEALLEWLNNPGAEETVAADLGFTNLSTTRTNGSITVAILPTSTNTPTVTDTPPGPTTPPTNTPTRSKTPTYTKSPTNTHTPCPEGEVCKKKDDDGCSVVAPSNSQAGWILLIPAVGLLWLRRRTR